MSESKQHSLTFYTWSISAQSTHTCMEVLRWTRVLKRRLCFTVGLYSSVNFLSQNNFQSCLVILSLFRFHWIFNLFLCSFFVLQCLYSAVYFTNFHSLLMDTVNYLTILWIINEPERVWVNTCIDVWNTVKQLTLMLSCTSWGHYQGVHQRSNF